jgi:hypothetical protein
MFWSNCIQRDKVLFIFFLAFIAGQALFTIKGVETFPFWNYGMYSEKIEQPKLLEQKKLMINDYEFDLNKASFSKAYMEYQLANAKKSENFGLWLKRYIERHSDLKIEKVVLLHQFYSAEKPYKLIQTNEHPIYQH